MKKIAGILTVIVLFMALFSCSGPFVDPGRVGVTGSGMGGGSGGSGGSGGGGGTGNDSTNGNDKVVYYNKTKKELYFRADRWENKTLGISGSDWNTGNGLVLSDFFSGTLKKNAVYTVQISGNLDTSLSSLTVMFQNTSNSDWVDVNDWITPVYVSSGPIDRSFLITFASFTGTLPDPKKIAVEFSNQVKVSDNVSNKELMATISNFSMTIKETTGGKEIPLTVKVTGIPSGGHIGQASISIGCEEPWDGIRLGSGNTSIQNGSVTVTLDIGYFIEINKISGEPSSMVIRLTLLDSPTSGKFYEKSFFYNQGTITIDYKEFEYGGSSTWS